MTLRLSPWDMENLLMMLERIRIQPGRFPAAPSSFEEGTGKDNQPFQTNLLMMQNPDQCQTRPNCTVFMGKMQGTRLTYHRQKDTSKSPLCGKVLTAKVAKGYAECATKKTIPKMYASLCF